LAEANGNAGRRKLFIIKILPILHLITLNKETLPDLKAGGVYLRNSIHVIIVVDAPISKQKCRQQWRFIDEHTGYKEF
jgi:hypothetical protein